MIYTWASLGLDLPCPCTWPFLGLDNHGASIRASPAPAPAYLQLLQVRREPERTKATPGTQVLWAWRGSGSIPTEALETRGPRGDGKGDSRWASEAQPEARVQVGQAGPALPDALAGHGARLRPESQGSAAPGETPALSSHLWPPWLGATCWPQGTKGPRVTPTPWGSVSTQKAVTMSLLPRWAHTSPTALRPAREPHRSPRGLPGSSSTPAALGPPTTSPGSASIPSFSLSLPGGSPAGPTGRWPPREEGFGVGLCHCGIIALLGYVTTTASQSPSHTPHSPTPCDPVPTPPAPCVRPSGMAPGPVGTGTVGRV